MNYSVSIEYCSFIQISYNWICSKFQPYRHHCKVMITTNSSNRYVPTKWYIPWNPWMEKTDCFSHQTWLKQYNDTRGWGECIAKRQKTRQNDSYRQILYEFGKFTSIFRFSLLKHHFNHVWWTKAIQFCDIDTAIIRMRVSSEENFPEIDIQRD